MDTQQNISERIKKLLKERNLKIKPFGEKLGIHNLSRMFANERNWTIRNLEKIADALGVTVGALAYDFADIPLLVEVGEEPFLFPQEIDKERAIAWIPAPIPLYGGGEVSKMYAIRVKNERIYRKPKTLIIEKDGIIPITNGDDVVYCCPKGYGHLGQSPFTKTRCFLDLLTPWIRSKTPCSTVASCA